MNIKRPMPGGMTMLEALFQPSSIAIIGASPEQGKVGHEIVRNILNSGFKGKIFPINPSFTNVLGLKCYSRVFDVPDMIDLGLVAVPARIVPSVVEDSGKKGLKALIVISSGFKESGGEGARLEKQIVDLCKQYNVRLLGPNCLGLVDTHLPVNASFAATMPLKGNIAFVSQSGALGTAILDWTLRQKIGLSKFVSIGNKADLDETDILWSLADDDTTKVILLYLEGINRGEQFIEAAEKVSFKKPVVVLKSGVTVEGARAVSSHTGSLAGSDMAFSLAFKKAGVIRVNTAEELFDVAKVFSTQPIPKGPNVAIVTNAGGPGILATDACEKYGLRLAPISPEIVEELRRQLPPAAGFFNPIDIIGDADSKRYQFAIETILKSNDVHNLLVILTPQAVTQVDATAKTLLELRQRFPAMPMVASFIGGDTVVAAIKIIEEGNIPNYDFPERAIKSLAVLTDYATQQINSPIHDSKRFEVNRETVTSIFEKVRNEGRLVLAASEANEVANAYGIPTPPIKLASTAEEAATIAESVGYPVVMKIESPQILHKTDIGGVKLNVTSTNDVKTDFYELIGRAHIFSPNAKILGVNIQRMVPSGKEVIIGMSRDITFGPLIMFGLGGIYVNFLKDVSFRLAPLIPNEALEMMRETKAYTLLRGIRGEPSLDIDSVLNTLLRVSQLVTDFSEINEMDVNPLLVYEKGCMAIDVKITIKP
ncbi:MAG: acetate--CoA ligase family protein [Candidatus Bathyarchaeota archaeon]